MAPLRGTWRIVEMDMWDREAIDLLGPACIEFATDDTGKFRFIAVDGYLDCRHVEGTQQPRVEFTWEGDDDGHPVSGRGWAVLELDGSLRGRIYFHLGDESGFKAFPAAT